MKPTAELYNALQIAYDEFNVQLFNCELPDVIFTSQRQRGSLGYFAPNRWGSDVGSKCHEIAINPAYVGRKSRLQLLATLAHEMVHCWQQCFGVPPKGCNGRYHNEEWAGKMHKIGLIPSSTGHDDGKQTGQKMHHYPAPNGNFILVAAFLTDNKNFTMPWVDVYAKGIDEPVTTEELAALENIDEKAATILLESPVNSDLLITEETQKETRIKYTCPHCAINVWGKPQLALQCLNCNKLLVDSKSLNKSKNQSDSVIATLP